VGTSAVVATDGRWTHSFLVGVDGYTLAHVDADGPFPSSVDSALRAARGSGDRATLRATSVAELGSGPMPATLTLGVEHSVLRQATTVTMLSSPTGGQRYPTAWDAMAETWNHNTGLLSQLSGSWRNALFVSGGIRMERNDAFSGPNRYPVLPMLGVAGVRSLGGAELKLRAAYGKGIRPPQTPARVAPRTEQMGLQGVRAALDPEVQSGIEMGAELYVGRAFSMQATRYDQRATGLIQNVVVSVDTQLRAGAPERRAQYRLQNVGAIDNRGWELQATLRSGPVALSSALTTVDSRVRTLAPGYQGDLRPGDRMLAVPARITSLTASWTAARWNAVLTATRARDWINYDRLVLAQAYLASDGPPSRYLAGPYLRAYWRAYDGDTHLRLAASRDLPHGVALILTGDNLLGGQLGEPDNGTIRPGRTLAGGLRASF
jgi:iron complex outermembrane receptor protein